MTKKLLPAMIGLALAGGMSVAAADVTLSGFIDTSLNSDDTDNGVDTDDDLTLGCNTCAIGVKGSEDLGNGLKAIFKAEWQFDATERNNGTGSDQGLFDRDQWLGLAGNFGKIRIGTISTVYKSHGAKLDPLYRTSIQGRDRGLQSNYHNGANNADSAEGENRGRSDNTVRWDSKNFSGLKVGATYSFDQGDAPTDNDDIFGLGASYQVNDNAVAFIDYITDQEDAADEDTAWKLGGKIGFDNINVMAQYEDITAGTNDLEVWHLGGSLGMGNNLFYLGYGMGEGDGADEEYDAITLAWKYSMSKQTSGYVGYTSTDCDPNAPNVHSVCLSSGAVVNGDNERLTVGLRHKF